MALIVPAGRQQTEFNNGDMNSSKRRKVYRTILKDYSVLPPTTAKRRT